MTIRYPLTDLQSRSPSYSLFYVTLFLFGGSEKDGSEVGEGWVGCDRGGGYFFERLLEVWQASGPLNTRDSGMTDRWGLRTNRVWNCTLGRGVCTEAVNFSSNILGDTSEWMYSWWDRRCRYALLPGNSVILMLMCVSRSQQKTHFDPASAQLCCLSPGVISSDTHL